MQFVHNVTKHLNNNYIQLIKLWRLNQQQVPSLMLHSSPKAVHVHLSSKNPPLAMFTRSCFHNIANNK